MEISELFEKLEQNPSDLPTIDAIQNACIPEADRENLERAYALVFSRVEDPQEAEQLLRRVEMKIRSAGDADLKDWMRFYVGYVYWTKVEKIDKAEMLFRKVGIEGPYREVLVDFYLRFYAEKENWRKLEELLLETSTEDDETAAAVNVKRRLARLAEEKDRKDKAIAFWQGLRKLAPEDPDAEDALKGLYTDVRK